MAETLSIRPADLLIDEQNPRITLPNAGQHKALQSLANLQQSKLQKLAEHIVNNNGTNPADLMIVMPFKDDLNRYVVLEGNRRLAALKVLENPELLVNAVDLGVLKVIRGLSKKYLASPIEQLTCLVVQNREEARPWIELRHTGMNEGAGIVPWGTEESGRFRARTGVLPIASQALNFLEGIGSLTPEERKNIPVTSFKRLIDTPEVRAKLGLEVQSGNLALLADAKTVAKALLFVVGRLSTGKTKVTDIYTRGQRLKFANNTIPKDLAVSPKVAPGHGTLIGAAKGSAQPKGKAAATRSSKLRDKLIPRDCTLNVIDTRVRQIEGELRRLSLGDYTNAVSILFRVFIELSADCHITKESLATKDEKLSTKLLAVTSDLIAKNKLTTAQAAPVRQQCHKDSFLAPSTALMNEYVHNRFIIPAAGDLRTYWDNLQPFITAVWAP
jgi:hypothetical protein